MRGHLRLIALVIGIGVMAAGCVDAIRQDSFGPLWTVAWMPAVLVGVWCAPRTRRAAGGSRGGVKR
jgi:hypothetical protein